ncbi:ABC transporter ATP-binding protein [Odoribacter sp. OttesenSCG-928-J03]|nr:ABC transporter ATP-binding protein [Odoribacter sp. OttesenSCG-928-J03]MDL2283131.1 ABC transporter ATP-binding protein [Odoribacter sp. OttesenSCG-928-G04]MDL2330487.1 ABC transporter ATP-binding protein [Odoribacter sp. OttesenSCG-928-A06]
MSAITANNLTIGYKQGKRGNKIIHENLSFSLEEGELTCLLGPNGAGKSTLLRTISGSQQALGGELLLEGRPLTSYNDKELARTIGLVLTDRTMGGGLSVYEMVALGRQPHTGFFGRLNDNDREIVQKSLDLVGISHKADSYVAELSDGVRQKVMIAKALAQECPMLLLDEPTAFLDVVSRIEIMNLLHELAAKQHKTILLSTHDMEQALLLGDRLWLLSDENSLQCGVTEDLILSGAINKFFSRNEIAFDQMSGNFRPHYLHSRKVYLQAVDELRFWTKNLLMRNGFQVTEILEDALFTVEVVSAGEIRIICSQTQFALASFAELADYLKR